MIKRSASRVGPVAGARTDAAGATRAPGPVDGAGSGQSTSAWGQPAFRLFVSSVVIAAIPIVVATVRAVGRGWIPLGDDADFTIRARDVFGSHIPLLGAWSSGSLTARLNLNHPGPLLFDALAVPVRLFGGSVGVAVGVALINVAAVVGIAVFAYRRGGPLLGVLAMVVTSGLCWAMGSELLFEPWQPHVVLIPFLLFLVLVWSMTSGDLAAVPVAAGVGSFIVQTHLSYAFLVPALAGWGMLGLFLALRRERSRDPNAWHVLRRHALRASAGAGLLLVVAWIQPIIEQFTSAGQGNLTRLAQSASDPNIRKVGARTGTLIFASVASLPPWWFRPSVQHTFATAGGWSPPPLGLAIGSILVLAGVLAWCWWDARRHLDRIVSGAVITAAAGLCAGYITAVQSPVTLFGAYAPHAWRFLWPLAAFAFFAVAALAVRRFQRARVARSHWLVGGCTLLVVVFAGLNLPTANLADGPNSQEWAIPAAKQLDERMGALDQQGPLLIDALFHANFASPYDFAVLAELQRRGIPFVAKDPGVVRQLGPGRQFTGTNAKAALILRIGEAAVTELPGARRVVAAEGASGSDQRELSRIMSLLGAYIERNGLRLNARGEAVFQRGGLPNLSQLRAEPGLGPANLFSSRELLLMINLHYLVLDQTWRQRVARYAQLQDEWDRETVALFVKPLSSGTAGRR